MNLLDLWQGFSRVGKIASIVAAITGAIVGIATAWPYVDPLIPAHRHYVIRHVADVQTSVNQLMIWRAEDAKNKARSEQADWSIKLQKEQDSQTRDMIKHRVEQLGEEQHQLDERISKLKGQ